MEFEKLQKNNPEEALAKLEQLDKSRAEERMSLRHKGTGQWAKNKQIRAKYNKEVSIFFKLDKKFIFFLNSPLIGEKIYFLLLDSTGAC